MELYKIINAERRSRPLFALRHLSLVPLVALCLAWTASGQEQITTLASFNGSNGEDPTCDLTLSGGILYGTTHSGGSGGVGTVFSLPVGGGAITTLATFNNTNGASPAAGLTLNGNTLYGTTAGANNSGSVFSLPVSGGAITTLTRFNGAPKGGLTLSGSILYGTSSVSAINSGTVFAEPVAGGALRTITSFSDANGGATDGWDPTCSLTLSGGALYGATSHGGEYDCGTVFSALASGFEVPSHTILASFDGANGSLPVAGLTLSGNTLYGATSNGGANGYGTVFSVPVSGGAITTLATFNNTNGAYPRGRLTLNGNILYGATSAGGANGYGTVFSVPVSGGPITTLATFNNTNGASPVAGLTLSGNTLYGTTSAGGANGNGTVFSLVDPSLVDATPAATPQTLNASTHVPLAITLSAAESVVLATTYQLLTQPLHGVLSGTAPTLTYTSGPAYTGADSFTFQATDAAGTSAAATVSLTVYPPVSKAGYYSGHYLGLLRGADPSHSGTVKITSSGTGAFTGSIVMGGRTFALKGAYDQSGNYAISIPRKGTTPLTGNLSFGLPLAPDGITGTFDGAPLAADNTIYSASAPTSLAGRYTVKIPSDPSQTDGSKAPQGFSVGTLVVASSGTITFAGTLADGTKFSRGTSLTRGGVWSLYIPLYAAGPLLGMLEGTIQFQPTPQVSNLDGAVTWIRPALSKLPGPATAFYPDGFSLSTHLYGAVYDPKGNLVVTPGSASNTFNAIGGSVAAATLTEAATAGAAASSLRLTGGNSLTLTLTASTGLVAGSFKETTTSTASPVNAIIYQSGATPSIVGEFTDQPKDGTKEGGAVTLTSP